MVTNAHRINSGPAAGHRRGCRDFFLFAEDDTEDAAALTVDVVARRIPRNASASTRAATSRCSRPMHRGPAGAGDAQRAAAAGR